MMSPEISEICTKEQSGGDSDMARRTEDPRKKEEKLSHERVFQVFLLVFGVVLGAVLGVIGTSISNPRNDTRQKESLIRLIKASVYHEMRVAKSLRQYLAAKEDVERLVPQGFDSAHDPSLYLSRQASFGELNDTLLVDLQAFHRTMQSCINVRELFQEGLSWCQENKGKPLPEGYLGSYIAALDLVELKGQRALSTIEALHPDIKLDTGSERAATVIEYDLGGYVPQQE